MASKQRSAYAQLSRLVRRLENIVPNVGKKKTGRKKKSSARRRGNGRFF